MRDALDTLRAVELFSRQLPAQEWLVPEKQVIRGALDSLYERQQKVAEDERVYSRTTFNELQSKIFGLLPRDDADLKSWARLRFDTIEALMKFDEEGLDAVVEDGMRNNTGYVDGSGADEVRTFGDSTGEHSVAVSPDAVQQQAIPPHLSMPPQPSNPVGRYEASASGFKYIPPLVAAQGVLSTLKDVVAKLRERAQLVEAYGARNRDIAKELDKLETLFIFYYTGLDDHIGAAVGNLNEVVVEASEINKINEQMSLKYPVIWTAPALEFRQAVVFFVDKLISFARSGGR